MTKASKNKFYPSAMSIAGCDSGGGAGIAADLRTFNTFGVFGTCAVTAITAQNPAAVRRIDPLTGEAVSAQIDAVMEKIAVRYAKTGMLFSADVIQAVARCVEKYQLKIVCDPVMISTSGSKLLESSAVEMLKRKLLVLASWITPNVPEAEALTGMKIRNLRDMIAAARKMHEQFNCSIWLKGGHLTGNAAQDVICREDKSYTLTSPLVAITAFASHGTGCTLSAALTAALALDLPWKQAVCSSKALVYGSLEEYVNIGAGVNAMYPPSDDYSQLVKLSEAELG